MLKTVRFLDSYDVFVLTHLTEGGDQGSIGRAILYLIDRDTGKVISKTNSFRQFQHLIAEVSTDFLQFREENNAPTRELRVAVLPIGVSGTGFGDWSEANLLNPLMEYFQKNDRFTLSYVYAENIKEKLRVAIEQENVGE